MTASLGITHRDLTTPEDHLRRVIHLAMIRHQQTPDTETRNPWDLAYIVSHAIAEGLDAADTLAELEARGFHA